MTKKHSTQHQITIKKLFYLHHPVLNEFNGVPLNNSIHY